MRPLNFAILKYLTTVDEACPEDIIEALKGTYGSFRALNKKDILSALGRMDPGGAVLLDSVTALALCDLLAQRFGTDAGRARPAGGYPAGVMDLSLPLFVIWL